MLPHLRHATAAYILMSGDAYPVEVCSATSANECVAW